ncbi:MAG: VOC family protein [Lewinellaceae bacterium]|jgi:predicted enzyme related to lactoylglutathione lyase|nr:VOC family protein [Lewinellaceae bacterium]
MKSWTTWFEIPAVDIERAKKFYDAIFQMEVQLMDFGGLKMGMFPHTGVAGALCQHESYQPSDTKGVLVYLEANPDLNEVLDRVEAAGGRIIRPKTQISPEYGYMAIFVDSEGNRMALHSNS